MPSPFFLRLLLAFAVLLSLALASPDEAHVEDVSYEPTFVAVDPSLVGRQASAPTIVPTGLSPDTPMQYNHIPGSTAYYSISIAQATARPKLRNALLQASTPHLDLKRRAEPDSEDVEVHMESEDLNGSEEDALEKRQTTNPQTIYVSINTCQNPTFTNKSQLAFPPQLTLEVAALGSGQQLGSTLPSGVGATLNQGFAALTISTSGTAIIAIVAPQASILNDTAWSYQVAASFDQYYHQYIDESPVSLKLIDSDAHAALLTTQNLTSWSAAQTNQTFANLDHGPVLDLFVYNSNYTGLNGLLHSFCAQSGSSRGAQVAVFADQPSRLGEETGLTISQPSNLLEQQFYVPGLNRTSLYLGRLATLNGSTFGAPVIGGGGVLYNMMNFTTKMDENCAVIYNLSFCSSVNYAVPANPNVFNVTQLAAVYDNNATSFYQNFTYSLQQNPCNTTASSQYSLAVNCTDCENAYKTWLCAVTIPKCADFSLNYNGSSDGPAADVADPDANTYGNAPPPPDISYLMPRNVAQAPIPGSAYGPVTNATQLSWLATNSSRNNATIAGIIRPGPYMEILPCEDLCYDIVRMCPSKLGFACPYPGSILNAASYGKRGVAANGEYTCSAPGAVYYPNGGGRLGGCVKLWACFAATAVVVMIVMT